MLSRHSVRRHQDNKLTRNVIFVDYDKQAFTVSCVLPVRRTIVSHLCRGLQASPHSKLSVIAAVVCGGLQASPHCKLMCHSISLLSGELHATLKPSL